MQNIAWLNGDRIVELKSSRTKSNRDKKSKCWSCTNPRLPEIIYCLNDLIRIIPNTLERDQNMIIENLHFSRSGKMIKIT